jgi:hypothetical protein
MKATNDDWYKIIDGTHRVRFLPEGQFNHSVFITRRQHYVNGHGKLGVPIACRKKLVNGSWTGNCPLCDHYESLVNNLPKSQTWKNDVPPDEIRSIKAVQRYYYNVLVTLPDGTKTLKLLSLGAFIHDQIFGKTDVSKNNHTHLTDLRNGLDVTITKSSNLGWPQFHINLSRKESLAISEDSFDRVMANCRDLIKVAQQWEVSDERMKEAIDASMKRLAKPERLCKYCTDPLEEVNITDFCSYRCHEAYLSYEKNNLRNCIK